MATTAILDYIEHTTYPDSESVSSATLTPPELSTLLSHLQTSHTTALTSLRNLSASTSTSTSTSDSDSSLTTWLTNARALQTSIRASLSTASQILASASTAQTLHAAAHDARTNLSFLEKESAFNAALLASLEHIRHANDLLQRTQDEAVVGNVAGAIKRMEEAGQTIKALPAESRARALLEEKEEGLKENLRETTEECWGAFLMVGWDVERERERFEVRQKSLRADVPDAVFPEIYLGQIVDAAKALELFGELVEKLGKELVRVVVAPRLKVDEDGLVARWRFHENEVVLHGRSEHVSAGALFRDLSAFLEFLATRLPASVAVTLSETLVPSLSALITEHWLEPATPLTVAETADFTILLQNVTDLIEQIDGYGWHGADALRTWVENVPTMWLTKQREAVLGEVRNLVFVGLQETKVVERVETRVVKKDDAVLAASGEGEEDWDTAWDEPEVKEDEDAVSAKADDADDEDTTAWDTAWDADDDVEKKKDEANNPDASENPDEDDAWGAWDDDNDTSKPPSPVAVRKQPATKPNGKPAAPQADQELTLRETFTVTSIPAALLTILQRIVSDAETLSTSDFATSPLQPAAPALYTLPTLALAIYRATAPTTYTKLDAGNMLIYNDALRLADLLREWQESRSSSSSSRTTGSSRGRLRLDADLLALETFAKRAYASEMESQRTILRDLLDGTQGFANCVTQPFARECENAVDAAVARLRELSGLWGGILARGALLQSLGALLGTLTGKMIAEVEDLGDIGEAESAGLRGLCGRVMDGVKDLFVQEAAGEERDMTFVYCPSWLKFQYLAEILESSLADIRWMWKEGELGLEFEREEVVELILALFAESEYRRTAVREIRRS